MSNFFQPAGGGTPSDGSVTIAKLDATTTTQADDLKNLTLATSVGSNALTIALKTKGGTDASASDPITIGMRNATSSTGTYNQRQVTGSLSLVISSGSTLGHTSAVDGYIYVYAIDNSGTIELAASSRLYDDGSIVTTTAEGGAGGADSATVIYSTTARSNVPLRLIGRLKSNQTTAGTWAANMTEISLGRFFKAKAPTIQMFGSGSGTYTTPAGVAYIRVRMVGGGGGGGGGGGSAGAGTGGGATTFGTSLLTCGGGAGGSGNSGPGGTGGAATVNSPAVGTGINGGGGDPSISLQTGAITYYNFGGTGAASFFGGAGRGGDPNAAGAPAAVNSGSGGGGGGTGLIANQAGGAGGGAGAYVEAIISAPSLASSYAYAVGSGGNGGTAGGSSFDGGAGGSGYIEVTEFYFQ